MTMTVQQLLCELALATEFTHKKIYVRALIDGKIVMLPVRNVSDEHDEYIVIDANLLGEEEEE